MAEYFSNFPLITYSNTVCRDITRRVAVRDIIRNSSDAYAPYELKDGQRADQIAGAYYSNDERDWLVWLSNDMLDPYSWHKGDEEFNRHIVEKYGSIEIAKEYIHHWQSNWWTSDRELRPASWAVLDEDAKKYYEPKYQPYTSNIVSYIRREEDWMAATNQIQRLSITGNNYTFGEKVTFKAGSIPLGSAEIIWANSTVLKVQHLIGIGTTGADTSPGVTVTGTVSNAVSTIASREYVANVIPDGEGTYWTPVSYYDWEFDKNEGMRRIKLIDRKYVTDIEDEMRNLAGGIS